MAPHPREAASGMELLFVRTGSAIAAAREIIDRDLMSDVYAL
jgi:hypothetical protein